MFMVYVSAILTLVMFVFSLAGIRDAKPWFILAVSVILWFTDLFGNFSGSDCRIWRRKARHRQMP